MAVVVLVLSRITARSRNGTRPLSGTWVTVVAVVVHVLVDVVELVVAVAILARIELVVVVVVFPDSVGPAVAIDVLPEDALASGAGPGQAPVEVLVLSGVEHAVFNQGVLENVEGAVTIEVLARVALARVDASVVIAVGEQNPVVVGVGVQRRDRLGLRREVLDRGLEEDVRVEDRRLLERQVEPAALLGVARLHGGERIDPQVAVLLGIPGRW